MSKIAGTRIGNKIVDAQPEPQPERPDWLMVGSLVASKVDLCLDQYKGREGWLTYAYNAAAIQVKQGQPGVYLGEERMNVTDRKGNTTRKVVHTFFIGGAKFNCEPSWFTEYTGEKVLPR